MNYSNKYVSCYKPLIEKYATHLCEKFSAKSYDGIPQVFLPEWGKNYDRSLVKTAFVGLETYGWGNMSEFLAQVKKGDWKSIFDVSDFQNLEYVKWTNGHRYTFWGFIMYFLGALYGVKNWELLKHGKHTNLLNDFVWGNATSVERYGNCDPKVVDYEVWEVAKRESETIDDFQHLAKVFAPRVVIMTCGKADGRHYLRNTEKTLLWDRDNVQLYKAGETLIFHMPHPNNMRFNKGADFYAKTIRDGLKEHGLFAQLKVFSDFDRDAEKLFQRLVKELRDGDVSRQEAVALVATTLRKQEAKISVRMFCRILNEAGYRTTYGGEYSAGRGSYKMIADVWRYYQDKMNRPDIAEDIALAFTKPNGDYAYC